MEINNTPLDDLAQVVFSGEYRTGYRYEVSLMVGSTEIEYNKLFYISKVCDYVLNYTDAIMIRLMMGLGTYSRQVYPNRTKMRCIIRRIEVDTVSGADTLDADVLTRNYTVILKDVGQAPTDAQGLEAVDEETMNLRQFVNVDLQLFEDGVDKLRGISVSGTWRPEKPGDKFNTVSLLQTILSVSTQAAHIDAKSKVLSLSIDEIKNPRNFEYVCIPNGVALYDLPKWLQKHIGVYPLGLGSYISNGNWYVYQLYNTGQFESKENTLTVAVLPKNKFKSVEHTYLVQGNSAIILTTSDTGFKDDSGLQTVQYGSGGKFLDVTALDNGLSIIDGKATINKSRSLSQPVLDKRDNGHDIVRFTGSRLTANQEKQLSMIAARQGSAFKFIWENSLPDIVYPGMPVRIIYSDLNTMKQIDGVLLYAVHMTVAVNDMSSNGYKTQSQLIVFAGQPKQVS